MRGACNVRILQSKDASLMMVVLQHESRNRAGSLCAAAYRQYCLCCVEFTPMIAEIAVHVFLPLLTPCPS